MRRCQEIEREFSRSGTQSQRRDLSDRWQKRHCSDYTRGDRLAANQTNKLIFDIGFHSGDDTIYFLENGHNVVAVDANPAMIEDGLSRPMLRLAERYGRLHAIATGIARDATRGKNLTFFLHRRVTEWSTFNTPPPNRRSEFDAISVPTTTCADLIRRFGAPHYMKIDIEGYDAACVGTLERDKLPRYLSTEDPSLLDRLLALGYRTFKMVSQRVARRGGRQFSGGMPEEANGRWGDADSIRAHPFFSVRHMHVKIDQNGKPLKREEHDLHAKL